VPVLLEVFTILMIAVGLAMDAFAVSVAAGAAYRQLHIRHVLRMAMFFGLFQAVMPLTGWMAGLGFKDIIIAYDHWMAFGLLCAIGLKMIYEGLKIEQIEKSKDPENLLVVVALAVATSIDALAVGITLSLLTDHIVWAVITIGIVTFLLSLAGCELGRRAKHFFENKLEIAGGVILIIIGLKILIEHLIKGI
jgi:putative Mn2+ efflux pump MntP